jgi:hypothetical protein
MGLSPGTVATQMQKEIKASGVNPVSRLEWSDHIPPEWPAVALSWMCSAESDAHLGEEISLRSPEIRATLGLVGMIRVDRDGPLWTVTLDRPDKANSLTGAMLRTLADVAARRRKRPIARADPDRRGGKGVLRRRRPGGGACRPRHRAGLGGGLGQPRGAGMPDHRGAERHAGGRRLRHGAGLRHPHRGAERAVLLSRWRSSASCRSPRTRGGCGR